MLLVEKLVHNISLGISFRSLNTSALVCGINKYTTPTRDFIVNNDILKEIINSKKEIIGLKEKEKLEVVYTNKNPRHMELMGFNKPSGFSTLYDHRNFYNKLNLEITNRHTNAFVENINGEILCYASTCEPYIRARLHNTTDVMAVVNVARILAERCKQTGIIRVLWRTRLDRTTEKIREFEGILINNGIILSEPATKVLQGPSQTLPPARPKRVIPRIMNNSQRRKGTIYRKDKKGFINEVCLDG
ncbi:large ribosomal subunit protein uL18m [Hydra vulgaris]|uniref:Large ribosomal subunit protein uL18m n=1 Tax=Hydra vulgaris TaxID=6087 RepID=A0ABM4BKZ9_HYDVU